MIQLVCLLLAIVLGVFGQFPPEFPSTCASTTCLAGAGIECREVLNPSSGIVQGQCLTNQPQTGNEGRCTVGRPLLVSSTSGGATEAFCGRGLNRITCPSNWFCNIAPNDAYAVCCQNDGDPAPNPPRLTCASVTCLEGNVCREVYKPDGTVEPQCLLASSLPTKNEVCGLTEQPLLGQENPGDQISTAYCGLGARRNCPESYYCNVAPNDAYAVCCSVKSTEKKGDCPAVSNNGQTVGICAFTCNNDGECGGDQKCCTNECGGTVCRAPVTSNPVLTCETTQCGPNQRCELQTVQCIRAPCNPVPVCVDIERDGVCPAQRFTFDLFWRARCQRDCDSDAQCPGFQKCCNDFFQCGTKCQDPEPSRTCETTKCSTGTVCVMQQVQCIRAPCFPIPTCVNIADACTPTCKTGYKCQMEVNRFTRREEPTCVMDPENPPCNPTCGEGFECQLQKPWWCWFFCTPRPTCVRNRQCPFYPAWVNPNCVREDQCSLDNPSSCGAGTICCSTDCGRRCVFPLA